MPALQCRATQGFTNRDVAVPLKARARDVFQAVLKGRPPQAGAGARLMARGAERC